MPGISLKKTLHALLAAYAASGVSAHMIMRKPVPYNYAGTVPLIQVNPLNTTKFPFPGQGLNKVVEMANYTAGGTAEVSFTGAAVHGGGSCQFSIAYHSDAVDPATLKDPNAWRVLASVLGGCPGDALGNLEPHTGVDRDQRIEAKVCSSFTDKECSKTFKIPLPKELPSGRASFAWTWFNKIGNREMYMNMAPVTVSGGADEASGRKFLDTLPTLFIANIAGDPLSKCTTKSGVLSFPNPGKTGMVLQDPDAESSGTCEVPKVLKPTFENDITQLNQGGTADPGDSGAGNSSSSKLPGYVFSTSVPGGIYATTNLPSPTSLVTFTRRLTTTFTSVVYGPATGAQSAPVAMPSGSTGNGTAPSTSVDCKLSEVMICIGTTHFGLCNNGKAIPQPVAPGTVCSGGKIVHASA